MARLKIEVLHRERPERVEAAIWEALGQVGIVRGQPYTGKADDGLPLLIRMKLQALVTGDVWVSYI